MKYIGQFRDIYEKLYTVTIETESQGEDEEITLGGSPVTITSESDGLFTPIKSRGCTVEFVSKKYHFDLYSPKSREVSILITDEQSNTIFRGYAVPCAYSQTYSYLDNIQLNFVESLSTLKDYRWRSYWNNLTEYLLAYQASLTILGQTGTPPGSGWNGQYPLAQDITYDIIKGGHQQGEIIEVKDYISFLDIILLLLKDCGYQGDLYIHDSYTRINGKTLNELNANTVYELLYASPGNFYNDDEEKTPWTLYEVLEEILKFMNMSIMPYGEDIYIIDYRYLAEKKDESTFTVYHNILDAEHTITSESLYINNNITEIRSAGTPSISIDDIFNKVKVNDNLYTLDKIAPDLFDEKSHISITEEMYLDENEWVWTKNNYKKFLWWKYDESTSVTGYTYQTMCRFKPNTGWVHHFYKHSDLTPIHYVKNPSTGVEPTVIVYNDGEPVEVSLIDKDYYDNTSTSEYGLNYESKNGVNKYCNTVGCLAEHYGYVKELGPNLLPASFDWTDIMAFFVVDDTIKLPGTAQKGTIKFSDIPKLEVPVLDYTIDEEINYKPSSGTSWITISGDLFYQYNNAAYEISEGKKTLDQSLSIINTDSKIYCTCPVDKAVSELKDQKYCSCVRLSDSPYYGMGFGCWKFRLQIGNKYWKDEWDNAQQKYVTGWVDTPTDFYVRYNNNPDNNAEEYVQAFEWMKVASNTDYKDKTGCEGYCIPISADDDNAPSFGRLYLTVYTPTILPIGQVKDPFTIGSSYTEMRQFFFDHFSDGICTWDQLPPVIFAKNFELGYVYTDNNLWYKQSNNVNTPDRVYSGDINMENVKEFSDIELKINTEHNSTPISRSYVATPGGYLHSLEHACTDSVEGQETNDQVQEYNIIDSHIIHHSDRKPIYTANVNGRYKPYECFNYGRYLLDTNISTGISVPYDFVIDSYDIDLKYDRTNIKMIAY